MTKLGKRTGLGIAALALAVTSAAPATAPAATTVIGKVNLSAGTPNGSNLCGSNSCTSLNTAVDNAANYVASSPVSGTVTSWSFRTPGMNAAAGTIYALRVVRPAGNDTFRSIAATNSVTIPDTADMVRGPFAINPGIQIQKGDLIGLKVTSSAGTVPTVSGANTNLYKVFSPGIGTTDFTDGGPAIAAQQTNPGNQIPIQATVTFTTPPPGCPPNCPPPPPGAGKPSLSAFSVSPKTFRAASRGASVARTRRRVIPIGTKVSYRLSQAATTTFKLQRRVAGRRVNGKCVAPRRSNRTRRRCSRYVNVSGSFSRAGAAGANSFKFTGRLRGRKLPVGAYKVTAVASNANGKSSARTTTFSIVR